MELSSCPQCSAKRNIPLSFSFFLTNLVPSGPFLQPLRCEICAHDAAAYRTADSTAGVQHWLWTSLHAAPAAGIHPFCGWDLPTAASLGACSPARACTGALAPASRSAVEKAGKYSRVPPWTIGLFLYHFDCDFLSGNNADQLSICTGSPDESAVLISFSFAGGCYDISILSAAIAAEGAGNILG